MKIEWIETIPWPPRRGHGVEFHSATGVDVSTLFAFLEGYEWRYGDRDTVAIQIKKPENDTEADSLAAARGSIERVLLSRQLVHGQIDGSVFAWFNA